MSKTIRRLTIVFAAVLMVMMMAVPVFASSVTVTVHFKTFNTEDTQLEDKWEQTYDITAVDTSQQVTFNTENFTSVIPGANSTIHQYYTTPTVMDAIYSAYLLKNGSSSGWTSYWDTSSNPKGAYIYTLFDNPQITTHLQDHYWQGYTWLLYLNTDSTASTWNSSTRTGMLPYYGSNVVLQNGDNIYVRYLNAYQSW